MRAALVRVGIDQAYGGWNAPMDPSTNDFVYVPIPEGLTSQHPDMATTYATVEPALSKFAEAHPGAAENLVSLPVSLKGASTHLDPDFNHLTYGDNGERRGRRVSEFQAGDVIVFYAGLRPVAPCRDRLVYALVGLYRIATVARVADFPRDRWHENAHLRRLHARPTDIVVGAELGVSGRLRHCLPIGEFRKGAYRVMQDLLDAWGGLSCKDGFIQRSAVPPELLDPARFLYWFEGKGPELLAWNHGRQGSARGSRVHRGEQGLAADLLRPQANPNEMTVRSL